MENESLKRVIQGSPTKELFVNILTRDLLLEDAINDLIDNSIDGAKRLRPDGNYDGLRVNIHFDNELFVIEDNCGGIPIDIARNYAFRFGRPKEMQQTDFSIGQFGVGMKRAFFKLGKKFNVYSKSENSEFVIDVNIDDWLKQFTEDGKEDWSFEFSNGFSENVSNQISETKTVIKISSIHLEIVEYIRETSFLSMVLPESIQKKHMESMYNGLEIYLNDRLLECIRPSFRISNDIPVGQFKHTFSNGVSLELLYGVGEPIENEGGWYIFCNDRLLLGPEQTSLSGWTGRGGDGVAIYHQQFYAFRGLAFFRASNSYDLPWNTSKNNIEASSPVFLFARSRMIEAMKEVFSFLNKIKSDRENDESGQPKEVTPYLDVYNSAEVVDYKSLVISHSDYTKTSFGVQVPTENETSEKPRTIRIQYSKPFALVQAVKRALNAKNASQVGELTFEYYISQEEISSDEQ